MWGKRAWVVRMRVPGGYVATVCVYPRHVGCAPPWFPLQNAVHLHVTATPRSVQEAIRKLYQMCRPRIRSRAAAL